MCRTILMDLTTKLKFSTNMTPKNILNQNLKKNNSTFVPHSQPRKVNAQEKLNSLLSNSYFAWPLQFFILKAMVTFWFTLQWKLQPGVASQWATWILVDVTITLLVVALSEYSFDKTRCHSSIQSCISEGHQVRRLRWQVNDLRC